MKTNLHAFHMVALLTTLPLLTHAMESGVQLSDLKAPLLDASEQSDTDKFINRIHAKEMSAEEIARLRAALDLESSVKPNPQDVAALHADLNRKHKKAVKQMRPLSSSSAQQQPLQNPQCQAMSDEQQSKQKNNNDDCGDCCVELCGLCCVARCQAIAESVKK
jgi:Skp family chaperone for outer membrane proteins